MLAFDDQRHADEARLFTQLVDYMETARDHHERQSRHGSSNPWAEPGFEVVCGRLLDELKDTHAVYARRLAEAVLAGTEMRRANPYYDGALRNQLLAEQEGTRSGLKVRAVRFLGLKVAEPDC